MIPSVFLRPVVAWATFLLISIGTIPNCWAQKTLAWKFKKNSVTNVLIEQDTSMKLEVPGAVATATIYNIVASICFWDISLTRNPGQAASYVYHARGRVTRVSHERYVPKAYRRNDIVYLVT